MPAPILQISYSLANIENAVHQFWQYAHQYNVMAFSGELGAGKTTFIHALCEYLGVENAVSSPTFAIINEYSFYEGGMERIIHHMDWYRIKNTEEAINAGIEDVLSQKNNYSLIEWPEKAVELLAMKHLWIEIEAGGKYDRTLKIFLKNG